MTQEKFTENKNAQYSKEYSLTSTANWYISANTSETGRDWNKLYKEVHGFVNVKKYHTILIFHSEMKSLTSFPPLTS